jgi:glutamate-1-semialdehyde 2,1-aminomutase
VITTTSNGVSIPCEDGTVVTVTPIGGLFGATVSGVDLSQPLHPSVIAVIDQAFIAWHVLRFPDQDLTPADEVRAMHYFDDGVYTELARRADRLATRLADACASGGFAARFPVVGTLVGMVCGDPDGEPVRNFDEAKRTDEAAYGRFFHAMLREGVAMAPGAYEAIFVGLATTDDAIDRIADAAHRASAVAAVV